MSLAPKDRTSIEEFANAITHGVGLVLSLIGFAVLLALALMRGGPGKSRVAPSWPTFLPPACSGLRSAA
jgi:predicted membrane channel-forming protein YqfA (hemolysin III family)